MIKEIVNKKFCVYLIIFLKNTVSIFLQGEKTSSFDKSKSFLNETKLKAKE